MVSIFCFVCLQVQQFYESDEYSRTCPGKKECVSVKLNGIKQHIQKRLLLLNLKELHVQLLEKNNDIKIGFSKFCELRPTVCEYHQNAKLLTVALPAKIYYKELLAKMVCGVDHRDCMLHSCDECPGRDGLRTYLTNLLEQFDRKKSVSTNGRKMIDKAL